MYIKSGFLLKKIADEYTAIPYDGNYENISAVVSLNDTGAYLWRYLEEDSSEQELVSALTEEYGIDTSLAKEAVSVFLEMLREHNLLEES
ncbi:MAG: PqqD family protein [Clostridia bacterium]|nr:PqqD family protein [Clostridia bacterium]